MRATLGELRRTYEQRPNVAISSWLSLAEGLLIHFSDMGAQARDKFHRAYALSAAAGLTQINALSSAWLANMDYLAGNMSGMARFVGQALKVAAKDNHSALSRANLVVAHAYHLASRLDLARPWYAKAHEHATVEGDDLTIGALIHNMAWLRFANLRQEKFSGAAASSSGEHARTSAESTLQFESLFRATSLQTLAPILRAQILTLEGHHAEALRAFEEYLIPTIREGMARMHANLLADQAWCRLNLGEEQSARTDASEAESLVDLQSHLDDRASAHSRLAQVFAALGDPESSARHSSFAHESWEGHRRLQQHAIEVLSQLEGPA